MLSPIVIREITVADASEAAALSTALGYPLSAEEMTVRIDQIAHYKELAVFVACTEDRVIGWIDIGIVRHLLAQEYGEIGGLIVSEKYRKHGIGAQLLARAEQWSREHGMKKILVRSRTVRTDAHRFYLRLGYAHSKTSEVFTKAI